ncbi:MAG: FAD-dependent monooxygenase [Gaiellaceae bacterium]
MAQTDERALVVGAGIGGLCTALALRRAGIDATVFERAAELYDVGCVGIWVDGVAALDRLGLADSVEELGRPVEVQEWRTWRGKVLIRNDVGEMVRQHGLRPPVNIRRAVLLRLLLDALGEGVVQYGKTCAGFEQDESGVTVQLADGGEERGAVLVGADGVESGIRTALFGDVPLRYAGYQYVRALIEFDHPAFPGGKFSVTLGRGDRFVMIHTSKDVRCWFAVTMNPRGSSAADGAKPDAAERFTRSAAIKEDLLRRFRRFPEPTIEMIEATPAESMFRNDIKDFEPLERWSDGRVTILGDAAHAATPNSGRGAGEAMQDGVALADCLAGAGSLRDRDAVSSALRELEEQRRGPTADMQTRAWRIGQVASWKNPLAVKIRERMMRGRLAQQQRKWYAAEFEALSSRKG